MKSLFKYLLLLFALSVTNVFAVDLCPSVNQIKNVTFIKAKARTHPEWDAFSNSFLFDGKNWNVQLSFASFNNEIKEPKGALNAAQKILFNLNLGKGKITKNEKRMSCDYFTDRFTVYLTATNPPQ